MSGREVNVKNPLKKVLVSLFNKTGLRELWKRLLACIPGTRPFKRQVWKQTLEEANERYQHFENLESLDSETRESIRHQIRHFTNQLSMARIWRKSILSDTFSYVLVYGSMTIALLIVAIAGLGFSLPINWKISLAFVLLFLFMLPFFLAPGTLFPVLWGMVRGPLSPNPTSWFRSILLVFTHSGLVSSLVFGWGVLLNNLKSPSSNLLEEPVLSFAAALTFITATYGSLEIVFWIRYLGYTIERVWIRRRIPNALITCNLVQILSLVENQEWTSLQTKNELLELLEEIAVTIERGLERSAECGDAVTDSWLKERARGMSAAVRELKKWVITPKKDTRGRFIERIERDLIAAAQGNWDEWEQSAPGRLTGKQWLARVSSLLRTLVLALGPPAVFYGFQQTPWALTGTPADALVVAAFLWMTISLVAALDPLFGPKVDAMKDMAEIVPFFGHRKQP